mmetsp:Transcript_2867/g.4362  ORF Transcript_2867/g.4362 Transcript_2867/m.4362 type:complete len:894 (+) Transcript_2867:47-2728(+)
MSSIDHILDPLLSIEALCYGALKSVESPDNNTHTPCQLPDTVCESISYFLGSDWRSHQLIKLQSCLVDDVQQLRDHSNKDSSTIRKYLSFLVESLTNSKKFSHKDIVLTLHALCTGLNQLCDRTSWASDICVSSTSENGNGASDVFSNLQQKYESLRLEYDTFKEEKMLECYQQSKRIGELELEADNRAALSDTTAERIKKLEEELEVSRSREGAAEAGMRALEVEVRDARERIAAFEADLRAEGKQDPSDAVQTQVAELEAERNSLLDKVQEMKTKLDSKTTWVSPEDVKAIEDRHTEEITEREDQMTMHLNTVLKLQKAVDESEARVKVLQAQVDDQKNTSNEALEQRLNIALVQLDKFREIIRNNMSNEPTGESTEMLREELAVKSKMLLESRNIISALELRLKQQNPADSLPDPPFASSELRSEGSVTTLSLQSPLMMIEIGSFTTRVGIWDLNNHTFSLRFECPSVIARPRNPNISAVDLTRGASTLASAMYDSFREKNALAGKDAWYCAFSHPDAGLRGALQLSYPMPYSGHVADTKGFALLIEHCMENSCDDEFQVDGDTQVLVSYKLDYKPENFKIFTDVLFDQCNIPVACFMNEPVLAAAGSQKDSCLVVDIGSRSTTAVPVFENYAMLHCLKSSKVGGEHLTEFMESLIDAQGLEQYSSQLPRRRQHLAREVKQKHAFVAPSFEHWVEIYGRFSFEYTEVMEAAGDSELRYIRSCTTDATADIQVKESFELPDGTQMTMSVDRELFYCPEVLFAPFLHEGCQDESSLIDVILSCVEAVDDSVRREICKNVVVVGKTSLLKGMRERIQKDLAEGMGERGVDSFTVEVAEENALMPTVSWSGAQVYVSNIEGNDCNKRTKIIPPGNLISSSDLSRDGMKVFANMG